jgi:hypothetical protein
MTSCSNTQAPLSDDGIRYCASNLATLHELSVTDLSCINTTSIQELRQALRQSVGLAQHLLSNLRLIATTMAVDHDCLRQQRNQEWTTLQIAHNHVTQHKAEIQQLQIRNQETTTESNTYQDRIITLQHELNHEYANTEALWAAAAAAGTASGQ